MTVDAISRYSDLLFFTCFGCLTVFTIVSLIVIVFDINLPIPTERDEE